MLRFIQSESFLCMNNWVSFIYLVLLIICILLFSCVMQNLWMFDIFWCVVAFNGEFFSFALIFTSIFSLLVHIEEYPLKIFLGARCACFYSFWTPNAFELFLVSIQLHLQFCWNVRIFYSFVAAKLVYIYIFITSTGFLFTIQFFKQYILWT